MMFLEKKGGRRGFLEVFFRAEKGKEKEKSNLGLWGEGGPESIQ